MSEVESVEKQGKKVLFQFCLCFQFTNSILTVNKLIFPKYVWSMTVTVIFLSLFQPMNFFILFCLPVLLSWGVRLPRWASGSKPGSIQHKYKFFLSQEIHRALSAWFMCNEYQLQWLNITSL